MANAGDCVTSGRQVTVRRCAADGWPADTEQVFQMPYEASAYPGSYAYSPQPVMVQPYSPATVEQSIYHPRPANYDCWAVQQQAPFHGRAARPQPSSTTSASVDGVETLRRQLADSQALVNKVSAENATLRDLADASAELLADEPRLGHVSRMLQNGSRPERVVCIGDIHGNLEQLVELWAALGERMGDEFHRTPIVFLGDYCDRGIDTRGTLDFLIALKASHGASVSFVCGNHDFGMAAFLGCLPISGPPPFDLETTKNPTFELYDPKRNQITYWPHPVEGGMHYLGRRWAQGAVYTARPTMESYGVQMRKGYGEKNTGHDDSFLSPELRDEFVAAVPEEHKQFLRDLQWVHEQPVRWGALTSLVCCHAGLDVAQPVDAQMRALRRRDLADPVLYQPDDQLIRERLTFCTEREKVWGMPPELEGRAVLVSGHHGMSFVEGDRIILDRCGGQPKAFAAPWDAACFHPLEALILPERTVVGHDGSTRDLTSKKERVGVKVDEAREKEAKKKAEKEKKAAEEAKAKAAAGGEVCAPCE